MTWKLTLEVNEFRGYRFLEGISPDVVKNSILRLFVFELFAFLSKRRSAVKTKNQKVAQIHTSKIAPNYIKKLYNELNNNANKWHMNNKRHENYAFHPDSERA
jgi:hypothetical protein